MVWWNLPVEIIVLDGFSLVELSNGLIRLVLVTSCTGADIITFAEWVGVFGGFI